MPITYVGAGAAATGDGTSSLVPALPASLADNDIMVLPVYSRENVDGVVNTPTGWTPVLAVGGHRDSFGLLGLFWRLRQTGDVAPTVSFTGLVGGATGDSVIAQIAAWRGNALTDVIRNRSLVATGTSQDITLTGLAVGPLGLCIAIGGKRDDWTSVADLPNTNHPWVEIGEPDETTGADAGLVWDYFVSENSEQIIVSSQVFDITGGASAGWKGLMLAINPLVSAIAVTDAVLYCAQSHPTTDAGIVGGAIDPLMRATFTDIATDDAEVLSDNPSDTTQSMTIKGRLAGGSVVTETRTLNGTTAVIFSTLGVFERVEEVRLSGPAAGNVTLRRSVGGATIGVIPAGEIGFRRIFFNAYPHPTASKDYYEKVFYKNNHVSTPLQNVSITQSADPGALITFTLAASIDDSGTTTSRTTVPSTTITNPDTFDDTAKAVSGALGPGEAIGIWLKMTLTAAIASFENTYTVGLTASTAP